MAIYHLQHPFPELVSDHLKCFTCSFGLVYISFPALTLRASVTDLLGVAHMSHKLIVCRRLLKNMKGWEFFYGRCYLQLSNYTTVKAYLSRNSALLLYIPDR